MKKLSTPQLIEEASALLYQVYIEQIKWKFNDDNPSKLCVETKNGRKLLIDRFTKNAIWFGAFVSEQLVGCIRLCGVDENNQLEIEGYETSHPIRNHIPQEKSRCLEISKLATKHEYIGRGIVNRLCLACFEYCEEHNFSVLACTSNVYLKSFFRKIKFPLKAENAFKYEFHDSSEVNFYFSESGNEVSEIRKSLEYTKTDLGNNAAKIFKALEILESILPTPFYWMDAEGVVLGINDLCLKAIGTTREVIGKKPYEFYKKEIADHILQHNSEVIGREEILSQEEWIEDVTTKKRKCFSSIKAPLYDDKGKIIGIVGSSIEITAQKEAEQLRIKTEKLEFENHAQKIIVEEQAKFRKTVAQMAHDVATPLATLQILINACTEIPESFRVSIRESLMRIEGVTRDVLNQYTPKHQEQDERVVSGREC